MAKQQITRFVDDIDGTALEEGEGKHLTFSIEGRSYEIDLSDKNANKFYAALAPYVDAGRRVTGGPAPRPRSRRSSNDVDLAAVREWARANGHKVSERGRVSAAVLEGYRANS